jgi:hypothetical protein
VAPEFLCIFIIRVHLIEGLIELIHMQVKPDVTLREEYRLRVFENRVLRKIFGPKREEVAGGWRRLHKEELHNLYALSNTIRVIKLMRMK